MNLIERSAVLCKTLIILTGFCALSVCWSGEAQAQNPSASFTSNVFIGCPPLSVDFTNLSSQASSYYWDFGNGNVSTLTDPTTVYLTSGYYTVTLVAINDLTGNRDTLVATNYIHVIDDPVADFIAAPLTGCASDNIVAFTNLSLNANSYIWDFGDGNFSTQSNPVHSYTAAGVYNIKLIARNPYGCTNIKIRNAYITIYANQPAAFNVNQQSSCDPSQVFTFNATTPGATGWQWDFGDGNLSGLQNPSHVYGVPGSYTVSLIVSNANGCSDTIVSPGFINIGPTLVPSFTVNSQAGCIPFTTDFTCTVPGANSWLWDFGDGNTSTFENPSHTYANAGSYTITLTVTTTVGCNGTVVLPGFITVDQLPVPSFTVNDPLGCSPHTTIFNNTSANAVTYLWDFGNGITSTDPNPVITFPDTGIYDVTLTAFSANGCQVSITQTSAVTVENIIASFTASPRNGCAPLPVSFSGTATPAGVTWFWDFGDGFTGSGQPISHTYTAIGNYVVSLIVVSANGCTDTIVRNNYIRVYPDTTAYTLPDTIVVCTPPGSVSFTDPTLGSNSWLWDFGDGNSATIKNPTHVYTVPGVYTVTLNTGMAGGCSQVFNPYAIINVLLFVPEPIISVVTSQCTPFTVQLDNLTPGVVAYLWDFGDGDTSSLQNPVHVYAQPGTYNISLLLTSVNGCQTSVTATVTFGYVNVITVSDTTTCLGDVITFGLNPMNAFTSAVWDFGDGTSSVLLQPTHIYSSAGAYNVSVTVTDTLGCVYTFNYINPVYVSDPVPSFTINQPAAGCVPYDVQFINNSTGAASYNWNFGDGTNATTANPSHTYTAPGLYTVILSAYKKGCVRRDTIFDFITVNEAVANLSFTPDSGCLPMTVTFTDLSVNAISWLWDFGDGSTSNVQHPAHTFTTTPGGIITLIIVDSNGCTDTATATNIVGLVPNIQASDSSACKLTTISFTTSLPAVSYLWDFGDGTTSNLQNPVHVYAQAGLYSVSLTCVLASGCTTTTSEQDYISIDGPIADFMSPTVAICAPSLVSFVNQSSGASSWLWDFGDGTTAANENPSNIYNIPGNYTITLVAYSDSGCTDTLIVPGYITVPGTLTDFSASTLDGCENTVVQFTDLSINATSWFWNFGDGSTSTNQNPSHTYTTSGNFTVTLITYDSIGCMSFYSSPSPIIIHPNPIVQASVTPSAGCMPLTSVFANLSTGGISYTWHFGNGDTSNVADTVYTYNSTGVYYPFLIANSSFGCTDTFTYSSGVVVSVSPVPAFTYTPQSPCSPVSVAFTDNSTGVLNPVYTWDFGNGQTSTLQNPFAVYNSPGVYQVTLIVSNGGGCSDTLSQSINIFDSIVAAGLSNGTGGCAPYQVSFMNNSVNATNFIWNFGDGSSSTDSTPTHTYSTAGNYTVMLIAFNSNGCADTLVLPNTIQVDLTPDANFTRTPSTGCSPSSVYFNSVSTQLSNPVYSWNFGNGQTGNQSSATVVYASPGVIPVTLIVVNDNGCSDTITKNINVIQSPEAIGSASGYDGCAPFTVDFANNSLNVVSYAWNFGDGNTSNQASPTHIYTAPGNYSVTLIVSSVSGCVDTLIFPDTVHVSMAPTAMFTTSVSAGCTPVVVALSDQSLGLLNASFSWDFGNGQSAATPNGNVIYNTAGNYTISLIVTNQGGCSDSANSLLSVYDTPVALAATSDTAGCSPYDVNFSNSSINGTSYLWDFGDGVTSGQQAPSHTYGTAGNYTVTLIVNGGGGCSDTIVLPNTIHVKATPLAAFSPTTITGCTPLGVTFNNTSTGLVGPAYYWNFGNGITSSDEHPTINFTQGGAFPVTLAVTNNEGCSDTAFATVTSSQSAVAQAASFDSSGCVPHMASFNSTSLFADSVFWDFGDGNTSAVSNPQHLYNLPGTYQLFLIAYTNEGCNDTLLFSTPVSVHANPVASFSVSQTSGCSGSPFQFINQSLPVSGLSYQWTIGGNYYTSNSPSVSITAPGIYNAGLVVTNQFGCTDTMVQSNYLQVYDTLPPPVSPIVSVSVRNNTQVEITWLNNSALDLGAYVLYRFNPAAGTFVEIYRDTTPNNSGMNVISTFIDGGLNTLNNVYTYKLKTLDRCSYTLPMSALTAHATINITAIPVNNDIRVSWTSYIGCPVSNYELNRVNITTGANTLIATLPPNILTYLDQGFYCPEEYSYKVTATALCGSTYTSLSDTSNAVPANMLAAQKVEVVRSTVIYDRNVLTEWLPPVLAPNRVVEYKVMRSTDNINFIEIADLSPNSTSYIDYTTDVHDQEYYYRIDVLNDCMVTGTLSNNGSSILLKSNWQDDKTKLWWTPYSEWDTGVDYYILEKEESPGMWQPVKTVPGSDLNTILDE